MVSRQAIITAVVAIVMLVIGVGIGYGAAGTRVTTATVTSPTTLTFIINNFTSLPLNNLKSTPCSGTGL
jgi:hypothetical protein